MEQFGLAHQREQDNVERQLELPSDVGPYTAAAGSTSSPLREGAGAWPGASNKAGRSSVSGIDRHEAAHDGVIEDALQQIAQLRCGGFKAVVPLAKTSR